MDKAVPFSLLSPKLSRGVRRTEDSLVGRECRGLTAVNPPEGIDGDCDSIGVGAGRGAEILSLCSNAGEGGGSFDLSTAF